MTSKTKGRKEAQKPQEKQAQRTHGAQGLLVCSTCDWQFVQEAEHILGGCRGSVARATADQLMKAFPGSTKDGYGNGAVCLQIDFCRFVVDIRPNGQCCIERVFHAHTSPDRIVQLFARGS